jgi:branched-chain amino acid transport system ATP-binding protein
VVEQNAHKALSIAHYAYVLETGVVTLDGPGKDLHEDSRVREAYLGT